MKKIVIIIIFWISTIFNAYSQNAYYDALKLMNFDPYPDRSSKVITLTVTTTNVSDFIRIANRYGKIDTTLSGNALKKEIEAVFTVNHFFTISTTQQGSDDSNLKFNSKLANNSLLKGIGGLDVTNIASGISQFMIDRAKQELTIAFFDRLKKHFDENPEIRALFPKTSKNLENLLAYHYPEMLPALRTSFYDDLRLLPIHLDDILKLDKYKDLLKDFPEIRICIHSLRLLSELEAGDANAADIIDQFSKLEEWNASNTSYEFKNLANSIKLAAIFSNSLRYQDKNPNDSLNDTIWVSPKQLRLLIQDSIAFKIYLGLIYQQVAIDKICFYNSSNVAEPFTTTMTKYINQIYLFQLELSEFITLANKVDGIRIDIKGKIKNKEKPSKDDYYNYINAGIDVVEYSFNVVKIFDPKFDAGNYIDLAKNGNDLYRNVYKEEYPAAINNLVNILTNFSDIIEKKSGVSHKTEITSLRKIVPFVSKYGLFIANMVEAKTPEEVKKIMETTALPVGSSSIKKNSRWNVSIQSYLGASWNMSPSASNIRAWNDRVGIIAPIGIAGSYGLQKGGSISVLLSLFDLGAIVDYNLKQDTVYNSGGTKVVQSTPNYTVKLGQIFSPGAYLVYGMAWNLPLSFGIGGQYGPGLAKIESNGNTNVVSPYWRWNMFIAVDIPFFTIYNKERKLVPRK